MVKKFKQLAESVKFKRQGGRWKLSAWDDQLVYGGAGRSAIVFRIGETSKALKIFYPDKVHVAQEEASIYRVLSGLSSFPALHEAGGTYIVIDWIEGKTLFQCLEEGTGIAAAQIKEADAALSAARMRGLNPADVHLRNIMITKEGKAMIVDVARFRQTQDCMNWEDIKIAYSAFYSKDFFPKKIPGRLLNMIGILYKKRLLPVYRSMHAKNPQ